MVKHWRLFPQSNLKIHHYCERVVIFGIQVKSLSKTANSKYSLIMFRQEQNKSL